MPKRQWPEQQTVKIEWGEFSAEFFKKKILPNKNMKAQLLADFKASEIRMNGESKTPVHQIRRAAMQTFETLGFPTIKHEEWKYTNVKELVSQVFDFQAPSDLQTSDLDALSIPNLEGNILYFVNGVYQPSLSTIVSPASQLHIMPFEEALKQFPEKVEKYFARYADYSDNAFTALNTAFARNGVFIHVPQGKVVEQPIILRHINDARQLNVAAQPRNLIVVCQGGQAKIAESYRTLGDYASFMNTVTEVVVEQNAHVEFYKVQNESNKAYHIGTTEVYQSDNSVFTAITVTINGGFVRNNLHIKIDGQHAEANMFGLYMPNGNQHVDNHTAVDHAQPNSNSNELYKGILKEKSSGVFNGKIFVRQDAQKTNAFQSCKNVLLSTEASMNTKPQLEIWADDVKCSHGTTTGQMPEEPLFYLRSRGIPEATAKSLLMMAFAEDVVEKMKIVPIKVYLEELIANKISL
jgi:Fe-S cluster assembly protein SufD